MGRWVFFALFLPLTLSSFVGDYEEWPEIEIEPEAEVNEPGELFGPALVDLDELAQGFVLETRQIHIPGYPEAFNPSIIRWQGCLLMSFRIYDYELRTAHQIGLIWLDEEFNPIGSPQLLEMPFDDDGCIRKRQDPRLFVISDQLYVIYNNVQKMISNREVRRVLVAKVHFDGDRFYADNSELISDFEGLKSWRSEKNWVPFDYQGQFNLAYSLLPHKIMTPVFGEGRCDTVSSSSGDIRWNWGQLRGGSSALLVDGNYLSFFHSSCEMPSVHSKGKMARHYFMGAYVFSSTPPFEIKKISSEPIFSQNFYNGKPYKMWRPLQVVFPMGFFFNDQFIWVAYGRQDHEVWIVKLDKQGLYDSLTTVNSDE